VQPLLDAKAAVGNNVHSPVPGRRSIEDDVRLKSILLRVVIQSVEDMHLVGIRKAKITNIKTQKLQTIVQNVISLSAKVVSSCITQKVMYKGVLLCTDVKVSYFGQKLISNSSAKIGSLLP
jgi:hypothetical protein